MTNSSGLRIDVWYPQLAALPLAVYFLIGIIIMMAFGICVIILSRGFDGTFGKFIFKWGFIIIFLNLALLTNDLLHLFIFK